VHALNAALSSPLVVKTSNEQRNDVEHRPQDAHAFGRLIAIEQDSRYFRCRNERNYPMHGCISSSLKFDMVREERSAESRYRSGLSLAF
jgi:hypothetical protein